MRARLPISATLGYGQYFTYPKLLRCDFVYAGKGPLYGGNQTLTGSESLCQLYHTFYAPGHVGTAHSRSVPFFSTARPLRISFLGSPNLISSVLGIGPFIHLSDPGCA